MITFYFLKFFFDKNGSIKSHDKKNTQTRRDASLAQ